MDDLCPSSGNEAAGNTAEIVDAFRAALQAGVPQEQAGRQTAEANIDMLTTMLAERMLEKTDAAVADQRAGQARIARRWGTALDAYYMVTLGAAELGALAAQPRPQATFDSVSKALILLQAQACQTSFEVHALLTAGFPGGAYGRYRTLHELAVIAALMSQYGRRPGHADFADRYLGHTHINQYRQAEHRQRSGRELGWPPLPAGTMEKLKKEHDRLISRYGRDYREDYGWAAGLIQPPLTFARLEAKADMNYLRYLYVTGSHLIHASAHGMMLTECRRVRLYSWIHAGTRARAAALVAKCSTERSSITALLRCRAGPAHRLRDGQPGAGRAERTSGAARHRACPQVRQRELLQLAILHGPRPDAARLSQRTRRQPGR